MSAHLFPADGRAEAAWITRLAQPLSCKDTGPLAGLTFAVKDNIDVAGVPTTAACPAFAYVPGHHASVVARLLDAGARLAGKTNLDQFACGLNGTRSPYGAVPNAFDVRYISGGSSSGSAYVVATGQVDFALGTDTAGSGRVPAGLNNIVGLKPSRGLVSTHGVVPAAASVDCVSIFATTVGLAARVLQQLIGDGAPEVPGRRLRLASQPFPSRFRFGVPSTLEFFGDALARAEFDAALTRLQALGGTRVVIDPAPLAAAADLLYGSALVAERHAAIRAFFDAHEHEVMEPVRGIIAGGRAFSASEVYEAQQKLREHGNSAAAIWDAIDVLVVPTAATHYTIAQMRSDPVHLNRKLGTYTNFVNLLDYAAVSVPSSMRPDGLPFGVTLIAPAGSDWQLAGLGQCYHHASGLTQGATGRPLPAAQEIAGLQAAPTVRIAVVGAHLSGMPLNGQLTQRGARLVRSAQTTSEYRLFALPGTTPAKPGLLRVPAGTGAPIAVEIWEMGADQFGSFVSLVPPPLAIGTLRLSGGCQVKGFLCEELATRGARDITEHGGWRSYMEAAERED